MGMSKHVDMVVAVAVPIFVIYTAISKLGFLMGAQVGLLWTCMSVIAWIVIQRHTQAPQATKNKPTSKTK
jgi:hypothetical protein